MDSILGLSHIDLLYCSITSVRGGPFGFPVALYTANIKRRVCGYVTDEAIYETRATQTAWTTRIKQGAREIPFAVGGLLQASGICLGASPKNREEALWMLSCLAEKSGGTASAGGLCTALWEREKLCPTGMGEGIAIPHARTKAVLRPCITALTVPDGMEYPSLDGEPVRLLLMIATPEKSEELYMDLLAWLSGLLLEPGFVEALMEAESAETFCHLFRLAEEQQPAPIWECLRSPAHAMA